MHCSPEFEVAGNGVVVDGLGGILPESREGRRPAPGGGGRRMAAVGGGGVEAATTDGDGGTFVKRCRRPLIPSSFPLLAVAGPVERKQEKQHL